MATQTGSIELRSSKKVVDVTALKSEAVASVVSCYYRKAANGANPVQPSGSTQINTTDDDVNGQWCLKMPKPRQNSQFFTCERYTMTDGSISFSTMQPLNSETYVSKWVAEADSTFINGGAIYSNSVNTAQLAAGAVTAQTIATTAITSDKIAADAILAGHIAAGQVTTDELAANAVVADKIAANAITAQKIASTAVTADKIAAGSITIGKIDQNDANTANAILNSNINIGGKNILKDSEYMNTGWLFGSGATKSDDIITLVGSSSDWNSVIHSVKFKTDIYDGITPLVFSFDIKSSADCSIQIVASGSSSLPDASTTPRTKYVNWQTPAVVQSTGGVWKRYETSSRTIAISQLTNGSGTVNSGFIQIYARTSNTNIQIRHIQLEQGNISTDWSPAPEDFFDGIDEAAKTATDYLLDIDSKEGIKVQPAASTINYLQMNASDIRFVKDNVDVVNLTTSSLRIGPASSKHTVTDSNGFHVWTGAQGTATNEVAVFGSTARIGTTSGPYVQTSSSSVKIAKDANNYSNISTGGLQVFQGGNSVANFGSSARIGTSAGARIVTSSTGVDVYNKDNQLKASFSTAGQYIYGGNGNYPYVQPTTDTIKVAQSSANYALVTANGLEIFQNNKSVANFSSVARLGTTAGPKVEINSNGTTIYKDANNKVNMTTAGVEIFQGGNSVANFGSIATVGATNGLHVSVKTDGMYLYNNSTELAKFKANEISLLSNLLEIDAINFDSSTGDGEVRYNINNGSDDSYHSFLNQIWAQNGLHIEEDLYFKTLPSDEGASAVSSWSEVFRLMTGFAPYNLVYSDYGTVTDADDLPMNTIYYISSNDIANSWSHLQEKAPCLILTYGAAENRRYQKCWYRGTNKIYIRNEGTGSWSGWNEVVTQETTTTWVQPPVVSSAVTSISGGYYLEGKRCYVQLRCTLASSMAADATRDIFSTLPKPKSTTEVALNCLVRSRAGHTARLYAASTDTTAKIMLIADPDHAISASQNVAITGVYTVN